MKNDTQTHDLPRLIALGITFLILLSVGWNIDYSSLGPDMRCFVKHLLGQTLKTATFDKDFPLPIRMRQPTSTNLAEVVMVVILVIVVFSPTAKMLGRRKIKLWKDR